eukprot:gb/GECG01003609.1/.p1 GENE.gb/GECG01003609.1/~~gb/GECG01003609.1/.p1  ORF type:complete len:122 (+),score=8.78 gb/GECG01003609.1/:1-366(+)
MKDDRQAAITARCFMAKFGRASVNSVPLDKGKQASCVLTGLATGSEDTWFKYTCCDSAQVPSRHSPTALWRISLLNDFRVRFFALVQEFASLIHQTPLVSAFRVSDYSLCTILSKSFTTTE